MSYETRAEVHQGDCLKVLTSVPTQSIDLAYVDPPFFTNKTHRLHTRDRSQEFSFADLWSSHREYADFLYQRLVEIHRVLSLTGSVFFHCDRNANHLVRVLLDEVFGSRFFRSEIIWHYRRWSNSQRNLLPTHQTIYYYTKSEQYTFNMLWEDYSPATNVDQILQRRTRDAHNKSVYQRDKRGRVVVNGEKRGVPLRDVWDIPYLNPKAKERTGYPTQKPILLLERIINLATNEGDCVLDPFCGSGTTLIAAKILQRHAIGIDISSDAVELTRKRIHAPVKSVSSVLEWGRESYRSVDEAALSLLQGLDYVPVQRNKGMDAILKRGLGGAPIPVRVQRDGESVVEAATKLFTAARSKNAAVMFLIAKTTEHQQALLSDLPPGVVVVNAPAVAIQGYLSAKEGADRAVAPRSSTSDGD